MEYPEVLKFGGKEYVQVCQDYYRSTEIDINHINAYALYKYCYYKNSGYGLSPAGFIDKYSDIDVKGFLSLRDVCIENSNIKSSGILIIDYSVIENSNLDLNYRPCIYHSNIEWSVIKGELNCIEYSRITSSNLILQDNKIRHSNIYSINASNKDFRFENIDD